MQTRHVPLWLALAVLVVAAGFVPPSRGLAAPHNQAEPALYVVRYGDTLSGLAVRFNTTVAGIATLNGIANPNLIYVGQTLHIPAGSAGQPALYVVRPGDTLSGIAARFGTTYVAVAQVNALANSNLIYVGQQLVIPGAGGVSPVVHPAPAQVGASSCSHTIQRGETLTGIALAYGVNPYDIARANGIASPNRIYAGQRLDIPSAGCQVQQPAAPVPAPAVNPPVATVASTQEPQAPAPALPTVAPPPAPTEAPAPPVETAVPPAPTDAVATATPAAVQPAVLPTLTPSGPYP